MTYVDAPTLRKVVYRVAGLVLLVAGLAKLTGRGADLDFPTAAKSWFVSTLPVFEIALGVWLISYRWRYGSWLIAVATFGVFLAVNVLQIQAGVTDCGCFGSARVPPTATLVLDICVLVALGVLRPQWQGWPQRNPETGLVLRVAGAAALTVAVAVGYSHARYGSVQAAVAAAVGRPIAVVSPVISLGQVAPGGLAEGELEVANLTAEDVQVAYISTRCRCADFRDLPVTIPPGQTVRIGFVLRAPTHPGTFKRDGVVRSSVGESSFVMIGSAVAETRNVRQ